MPACLRRISSVLAVAALAAVCALAFALAPAPAQGKSTGANPGFAGDIQNGGTPQTCATCHDSFALNSGSGSVRIDAPTSVSTGETVTITVTVDNQTETSDPRLQGFQATIRDGAGAVPGSFVITDADHTKFASSTGSYVTHATPDQTSWSFDWVVGGEPGAVRIYVAGNAANGDGGTSGDHIYTATQDVEIFGVDAERGPSMAFDVAPPRPNPARAGQRVALALTLRQPGETTARLVDGQGRTVRVLETGGRAAGRREVTAETAGLAAGVYFVVVEGPGGRRVLPLTLAGG